MSIPIIVGHGKDSESIARYVGKCPICGNVTTLKMYEASSHVNLYFVPMGKFNKYYYLACPLCGHMVELSKEQKDALLANIKSIEQKSIKQIEKSGFYSKSKMKNTASISKAAIIILSGPLAGAEISLQNQEVIYIGKDPQRANIVFSGDFPNVSRLHCSVSYEEKFNKYFVTDCSTNGTFFAKTKERFVQGKRTAVSRENILLLGDDKARIQLK